MIYKIEDLIEISVGLNYRAYPMLKGMLDSVSKVQDPHYIEYRKRVKEVVEELEQFLSMIEANSNEEEGLELDDFKNREIH